ncbi:CDP-glycerol glycerophosphotransferase family protein [Mangrovimicrobium sediminis]|uniref:CDP-glycerol glycerophosphotransferase family protein n=1 Tax=Mangrovimicrobium sediminis TaxID=2562682 RepID=UPI001436CA26|nr:CDP-glycerol glycerophosphotransferase family protein [Haliea sp. SAOS-164]
MAALLRPLLPRPRRPLVLFYGHQFSGNLKALYREWERSFADDLDVRFIALDPEYAAALRRQGIHCLSGTEIAIIAALARCSVMVTDHGLHAMGILIHISNIRFVDVWHGIPFKGFVPKDFALQRKYDEIWLSSPLLAALYQERFGFERERLRVLGYARTDSLFNCTPASGQSTAELTLPPGKRILYAPTWKQDDTGRELFPFGETAENFVRAIAAVARKNGATLLIRSHLNSSMNSVDCPGVVFCSQRDFPDTEDLLLQTDILLCDWSSIAFDFLALRRPIVFLDVPAPFRHGFSLDASYRAGAVVDSLERLQAAIGAYLDDPERFTAEYGVLQEQVLQEIYAQSTIGVAAQQQLERLSEILA